MNYIAKLINGLYETFRKNARPGVRENYNGLYETFYKNVKPGIRTTYTDGKRDGPPKVITAGRVRVNDAGIEQIRQFLLNNHKHPERFEVGALDSDKFLRAWAVDAEDNAENQGEAYVELRSFDSASGCIHTFTVKADGLDIITTKGD
jgi:hypothetical protein